MQSASVPPKFNIPWGASAGGGFIRTIPEASQIGINDGWASLTTGFPPLNMTPEGSGGIPPFGQDMNGILKQVTQWNQWQSAGGPVQWDSAFSTAIGGYPLGAIVASATTLGLGYYCLVDNNTTNPDTGGAGWKSFQFAADPALFPGVINGLAMANTPAAPTTGITAAVGSCRDRTNTYTINNTAPFDKRLNATWTAGSGLGGKLIGTALAAGQTWHFFAMTNPATGAVDFGFDTSPTAPTMTVPAAAGFTAWRRIGAVVLEAATTAIRAFVQRGDDFMLQFRSTDYAATSNGGLVSYYRAITVPLGIVVKAYMYFQSTGDAGAQIYLSGIYNPAFGAPPAFGATTQWAQIRRSSVWTRYPGLGDIWNSYGTLVTEQYTDTAAHIYTRSSDTDDVIALGVLGWQDQRGQYYPET